MHVGGRIKYLIEQKSTLNKIEFANKIGHSEQSLHKILNKEDISTQLLKTICLALDITVSDFFQEIEPTKQKSGKSNIYLEFEASKLLAFVFK